MWNLDPSYKVEHLRGDLWEVDFEPEVIAPCGNGAFGLVFGEKYEATGLAVALDCIDPAQKVVRCRGDLPVRVAEWEDECIPRRIRHALRRNALFPRVQPVRLQ